ncbi:unnamed protein product [Closterium sp. NIES-54]
MARRATLTCPGLNKVRVGSRGNNTQRPIGWATAASCAHQVRRVHQVPTTRTAAAPAVPSVVAVPAAAATAAGTASGAVPYTNQHVQHPLLVGPASPESPLVPPPIDAQVPPLPLSPRRQPPPPPPFPPLLPPLPRACPLATDTAAVLSVAGDVLEVTEAVKVGICEIVHP